MSVHLVCDNCLNNDTCSEEKKRGAKQTYLCADVKRKPKRGPGRPVGSKSKNMVRATWDRKVKVWCVNCCTTFIDDNDGVHECPQCGRTIWRKRGYTGGLIF